MSLWRPEMFHGEGKTRDFFEGWYFKMSGERCVAVVPGVFLSDDPRESHSFVFVNVDGKEQHYYRFKAEDLKCHPTRFEVVVGLNTFRLDHIEVHLTPRDGDDASAVIDGRLDFSELQPWPVTCFSPGVMGPVAFLPFVECNHGILSMNHTVQGALCINEDTLSFSRGYIEKDWGKHFPRDWVWLQCNDFGDSGPASLFLSIASVPYMGTSFPGFICGLQLGRTLHRFCLYNLSRIRKFEVDRERGLLQVNMSNWGYTLEVEAQYKDVPMVTLYGPTQGRTKRMTPSVKEGLHATVAVKLTTAKGALSFKGEGRCSGIELEGDLPALARSLVR